MKNEKTRGTMLTSTALILCCVTFGAGFLCGDLVSEYRRAGVPAASVQASQAVQHQPAAEAPQDAEARAASHIAELREQVKKSPDDASLWTHLGNLCYDSGKFDEAIEAYGRSLALAPGDPNVITDMA